MAARHGRGSRGARLLPTVSTPAAGVTLDAGALMAFDRNDRGVVALLARVVERRLSIAVPAGALAQAWRDGSRQARLAALLGSESVDVEPLDDLRARSAGQLCGVTATRDPIDASVVLCARARGHAVLTSDIGDLRKLDPKLRLIPV